MSFIQEKETEKESRTTRILCDARKALENATLITPSAGTRKPNPESEKMATETEENVAAWVGGVQESNSKKEDDKAAKNSREVPPKRLAWDVLFDTLVDYKTMTGDCNVPYWYKNDAGVCLGAWVIRQRSGKDSLSTKRRDRLSELGLDWNRPAMVDCYEEAWQKHYAGLMEYKMDHGHCNVPYRYAKDRALGRWVQQQRIENNRGKLKRQRKQTLDNLGFQWRASENTKETDCNWEYMFQKLERYKNKFGTTLISQDTSEQPLAEWVMTQRTLYEWGKVPQAHLAKLEALGFIRDRPSLRKRRICKAGNNDSEPDAKRAAMSTVDAHNPNVEAGLKHAPGSITTRCTTRSPHVVAWEGSRTGEDFNSTTALGNSSSYPLWTKALQNLEKLPYDPRLKRKVIVATGPLSNQIGHIEESGHGWIKVRLPRLGITHFRRSQLYLHPDQESDFSVGPPSSEIQSELPNVETFGSSGPHLRALQVFVESLIKENKALIQENNKRHTGAQAGECSKESDSASKAILEQQLSKHAKKNEEWTELLQSLNSFYENIREENAKLKECQIEQLQRSRLFDEVRAASFQQREDEIQEWERPFKQHGIATFRPGHEGVARSTADNHSMHPGMNHISDLKQGHDWTNMDLDCFISATSDIVFYDEEIHCGDDIFDINNGIVIEEEIAEGIERDDVKDGSRGTDDGNEGVETTKSDTNEDNNEVGSDKQEKAEKNKQYEKEGSGCRGDVEEDAKEIRSDKHADKNEDGTNIHTKDAVAGSKTDILCGEIKCRGAQTRSGRRIKAKRRFACEG